MKTRLAIKQLIIGGGKSPQIPSGAITVNGGKYLTVNNGKYLIVNKG